MVFKEQFKQMPKSELLMYLQLLSTYPNGGECMIGMDDYQKKGYKPTSFYASRNNLMEKGILRKIRKDLFYFTPIELM